MGVAPLTGGVARAGTTSAGSRYIIGLAEEKRRNARKLGRRG